MVTGSDVASDERCLDLKDCEQVYAAVEAPFTTAENSSELINDFRHELIDLAMDLFH